MGDEIQQRHFSAEDFSRFRRRLDAETEGVHKLFQEDGFSTRGDITGFELEVWIVDKEGEPLAINERYLKALDNPLVVPELAAYNIELNGSPVALTGKVFSRLHDELDATWHACLACAKRMGCDLITIGVLPTIRPELLNSGFMSSMVRYQALNDRVLALRDGKPVELNIEGPDPLSLTHDDVMLEAAATSFQIHLQCKPERSVRDFNASLIASAPMVAASANSPYLFGHELWDESRIPLFEQAVSVGPRYSERVSFGSGYANETLFELFRENQVEFPILIPANIDQAADKFPYARFHNGTVWRWNRPLLGFDFDGQPHVRIEHRVVAAGPTVRDSVANTAFYLGLVRYLVDSETPAEMRLEFSQAQGNFYRAAKNGLSAEITWLDGKSWSIKELILEQLLPGCRTSLKALDIPPDEVDEYLDVIENRVASGQNGAEWQKQWVGKHGVNPNALTLAYLEQQLTEEPVHLWSI